MDEALKLLKSSTNFKKSCSDVENLISKKEFNTSSFGVSLLVEIKRQLDNSVWSDTVDCCALLSLVSKIHSHITSDEEYHNCLSATYAIYRFLHKQNGLSNDLKYLNFLFKNTKLPMKTKYYKIYWNMFVDAINSLKITNKSESQSVLLNIVDYVMAIMRICDLVQFCKSNLSWLVRKLFALFNETIAEDLQNAFEKIFVFLNSISSFELSNEYKDSLVLEETFKNILHLYYCVVQTISSIDFAFTDSITELLEICSKIFNRDKMYMEFFDILSSLNFLFVPSNKFLPDCYGEVLKVNSKLTKLQKLDSNQFFDFISIVRKILNIKLYELIKIPKDLLETQMSLDLQESLLQLIITIMESLKKCDKQGVKCANCNFESGYHDALQVATFGRQLMANFAHEKYNLTESLKLVMEIFKKQIDYILYLRENNCPGWTKIWNNAEKGYHSDAILLYSLGKHQQSVDLFNIYLDIFTKLFKRDNSIANRATLSRVLYNMSVCQFEIPRMEEVALKSCYLSMALNSVDNKEASSDLYVQFIIKIKIKLIDIHNSNEKLCKYDRYKVAIECECCNRIEKIQYSNIWNVCNEIIKEDKNNIYGELLNGVDYKKLLVNELVVFHSFWFSSVPVSGICKTFQFINSNENHIKKDFRQELEILFYLGKMVTLLSTRPSLLQNSDIANLTKYSLLKYESVLNTNIEKLDEKNKTLFYLFYGNILSALYEILLHEKSIDDKFSPLNTTANVQKSLITTHPDDECDLASTHLSLRLSIEDYILQPILKAIDIWKCVLKIPAAQLSKIFQNEDVKIYAEKSFNNMESAIQILCLRGCDIHSMVLADVVYSLSICSNNWLFTIRTVGYMIQNTNSRALNIVKILSDTNQLLALVNFETKWFENHEVLDAVLEYLLNLTIYYHNCNRKEDGVKILDFVQNMILKFSDEFDDKQKIILSFAKLLDVQSLYLSTNTKNINADESITYLASLVNTYVEYKDLFLLAGRYGHKALRIMNLWIKSGLNAGKAALLLGLPRRSRAILKSLLSPVHRFLLPRCIVEILLILANTDVCSEKYDDCKVKLNIIQYIMEERFESTVQSVKKETLLTPEPKVQENRVAEFDDQFEMILYSNSTRNLNDNLSGSPTFHPSLFNMPLFVEHKKGCGCSKCTSVTFFTLTLEIINIQVNLFYKTNEIQVAQSFMNGGFKLLKYLNAKLGNMNSNSLENNVNFRLEKIEEFSYHNSLIFSQCQFLKDICYILIKENNLHKAENINKQAIDMLKLMPENLLLMQSVHEQRLFFLQSKVFKFETQNVPSSVDQLSVDLTNKLMVTPRKNITDDASFKTPHERKTRPPNNTNKVKLNKGKSLFDDDDKKESSYHMPTIKFNLFDDDTKKPVKCKVFDESIEKTPAFKFPMKKTELLESEPQTSSSNLSSKTRSKSNIKSVPKTSKTVNAPKVQIKSKIKSTKATSEIEVHNEVVKTRLRSKVLSDVSAKK